MISRIAIAVANFALPGSVSIAMMLIDIGRECANMHESLDMCVTVRERLEDLLTRLQAMEKDGFTSADVEVVNKYAGSVHRFFQALQQHAKKNVVARLIASTKFNEELKQVHEEIDMLFKMLNLAHISSVSTWHQKFEHAQQTQQSMLAEAVKNTHAIRGEIQTFKKQMDVLTMLLFECSRRETQHSEEQVKLIRRTFQSLIAVSTCKVKAIPAWFRAEDEVVYDRNNPFYLGSFGAVYRGTWSYTPVVIKTLLPELLESEKDINAFMKEIDIWHKLNHNHVLRMYGACHVSSPPFIISEDAVHGQLDHYLGRDNNQTKTWRLLHETAMGLAYVHSQNVVHGDLKCNNILVGADGGARLSDFGLSCVRTRSDVLSAGATEVGAMRWKAPECLMAKKPTFASDVYSLGMCIIEAVTQEAPWGMATDDVVRAMVVNDHALPEQPDCMSDRAWKLIERMCAFDPSARILMSEVVNELAWLKQQEEMAEKSTDVKGTTGQPSLSIVWYYQGNDFMHELDYEGAVTAYTKAIQADPSDYDYYFNRSAAYSSMEKYEDALRDIETAITMNSKDARAWLKKGNALRLLERFDEAVVAYNVGLDLSPGDNECRQGVALCHYFTGSQLLSAGKYREAADAFTKAMIADPSDADCYQARAQTYLRLDENDKAVQDAQRAVELGPARANNYGTYGDALRKVGRFNDSKKAYNAGLQVDLNSARCKNGLVSVWFEHANDLFMKEKYTEAADSYSEAISLDPTNAAYFYNRSAAFFASEDYRRALEDAETAVRLNPNNADNFVKKGNALLKMDRFQTGMEAYQAGLALDATNVDCKTGLVGMPRDNGNSLFTQNKYDEAVTSYARAYEVSPLCEFYHNRAVAYYELGNGLRSLQDAEAALVLDPQDADNWCRKGMALVLLKKAREADEAYKKGLIGAMIVDVAHECNNMKESEAVCVTVQERLQDILGMLQKMEKEETLPPDSIVVRKYAALLQRFLGVLREHAEKNAVTRMVSSTSLNDELRGVHEEIDMLFKMLDLAHIESVAAWEHQFDNEQREQHAELSKVVHNTQTIESDLRTVSLQVEALTTLMHASHGQIQLQDRHKSTSVHDVFFPGAAIESVPTWYIPPKEVTFDQTKPFKLGVLGASYSGMWGYGTRVVVKTLLPAFATDECARAAFMREMQTWHRVNHPHVLRMFGACHVSSPPYIICEYAPYGSLDAFLRVQRDGNRDHGVVGRLLLQAALGLAHLHQHGVLHGNLKCPNILVGADGTARIADFGISCMWSTAVSGPSLASRDVRWKAPECLQGRKPTEESDVYSFGMCIIEAVTLELPWGAASDDDVRLAVVNRRALPTQPNGMDNCWWRLVTHVCAFEPTKRWDLATIARELETMNTSLEDLLTKAHHQRHSPGLVPSDRAMHHNEESNQSAHHSPPSIEKSGWCCRRAFALPGSMSIAVMLIDIGRECENMHESMELCATVRERLEDLLTRLQAMEKAGNLPEDWEAVNKYASNVHRFLHALQQHAQKNVVARLIAATKFNEELKQVHEEIDMLFKMLNLAHISSVAAWHEKFEHAQQSQQLMLADAVNNTHAILGEMQTFKKQMDVLTMLLFEHSRRETQHTEEHLTLIRHAFQNLISVSKCKVQAIPAWFKADDEVVYDRNNPFDRGSFGAVYRGTWSYTPVVIKTLLPELLESEKDINAFMKEIDIWHKLNHNHVLRMYGACHVSSPPFIISEDAVHGQLDHYLGRDNNQTKTWRLLHETAMGLAYVHSQNVVHGDLKCNNILVGADGGARLSDFGLSCVRTRSDVLSAGATEVGAMRWKAPECLMAKKPTFASDVYSLGMCIIEAVTQEAPWGMATDDVVRAMVVNDHALPEQPDCMSDRAWKLIERMCAFDPSARILMSEVVNELAWLKQQEEMSEKTTDAHGTMRQPSLAKGSKEFERPKMARQSSTFMRMMAVITNDEKDKAPEYVTKWQEFLNDKQYDQALEAARKGRAADPEHANWGRAEGIVWYYKGNDCMHNDDYDGAVEAYTKAIEGDPSDSDFHINRSAAYSNLEKYEDALRDIETALTINSEDARVLLRKGNALRLLERFDEAIAAYSSGLELSPDDNDCRQGVALSYYFKGSRLRSEEKLREAVDAFTNAMIADPSDADCYQARAQTYLELDEYDKAVQDAQRAVEMDPTRPNIHGTLGDALREAGRFDASMQAYHAGLRVDSNHSRCKNGLVRVWFDKANDQFVRDMYNEAAESYSEAISLDPNNSVYFYNRSAAFFAAENYRRALEDAETAVRLNPQDPDNFVKKGNALLKLDRFQTAMEAFQAGLALDANNLACKAGLASTWFMNGNSLIDQDKYEEAVASFTRAIELSPKGEFYHNRSLVHHELGNGQKALQDAEAAIVLDPQDADNWCRKGKALLLLNKGREAYDAFRKGLSLDEKHALCTKGMVRALHGLAVSNGALMTCFSAGGNRPRRQKWISRHRTTQFF
ncbi:TPA: hypothetical protein N0F65_000706 [Lagenidium giganteum]|uniref:Protein kinase domain-containing protein n=1 Tax=Lagenidium giganteum TaxID=4803 RepID=A0AAV2ZDB5_9STRA|nr:TPA: hypothetical protein N0F65_000706 [Lagenidium giganteum]